MRRVGVVLSLNPALCTMVGIYTTAQNIITLPASTHAMGGGRQQRELLQSGVLCVQQQINVGL